MLFTFSDEMSRILFFLIGIVLSILKFSVCEDCVYKNTCECVFSNGSEINLNSLGSQNSYKWGNMKATIQPDSFTYFYNPCNAFKLGKDGACAKGVAACQVADNKSIYYDIGNAGSVIFHVEKDIVTLTYYANSRITNVTLICDGDAETPEFTVLGELVPMHYIMSLKSKCACPDLCRTSHLSTGSVLLILFMIFVSLYLLLGVIHSSLTRGAQGWELIPHYEFWTDFPLLVRDGCVFVVNGCKAETAYERI